MNYMSLFDTDGKRVTSVPCDDDLTDEKKAALEADGYVEIDEDEWNYYVGNKGAGDNDTGYVRGSDGKPTSAPAYVPTAAEKANALASEYESQVSELDNQIVLAMADGDTDLVTELKAEKETALKEYQTKLGALEK